LYFIASEYDRLTPRWNADRRSMNGYHDEIVFQHKDDNDEYEENVKDNEEMTRRSDSPVLRPLPSKLFRIII